MRLKARHLLIKVVYDDNQPDPTAVTAQIAKQISIAAESAYGDFGTIPARFGYQIKYFNPVTALCIIRIPRDFCETMVYSITNVKRLNGKPCKLDILHISGTINRCQQIAIELSRVVLKEMAFVQYLQSKADSKETGPTHSTASTESVMVLTNDGDIVLDPATVEKIAAIEKEIESIDAVQPMI